MTDNRTTEFIVDLSEVEKTSDRFKMLFNETIPLGKRIVRCRDYKYRHEGMCMLTDGMGDFKRWFVDDGDYCSDGERAVGA